MKKNIYVSVIGIIMVLILIKINNLYILKESSDNIPPSSKNSSLYTNEIVLFDF